MELNLEKWTSLLALEKECLRRGERLTRAMIKEIFEISEHKARFLHTALKYRDTISLKMEQTTVEPGNKTLVFGDVHIPYQDTIAVESMLSFADRLQPDTIVILGDLIDFYQVSRYVKNPKNKSVSQELKEAEAFLENLRNRYPKSTIHYLMGNHENRFMDYVMSSSPQLYDILEDFLPKKLNFEKHNILSHNRPFRLGRMNFLHGHEKPGGSYNPEYITNVILNYVFDNFIVGHYHRSQDKTFKRIDSSIFIGIAVGFLGSEMEYAVLNKWNHGFCVLHFDSNGKFHPRNYRILNGEIF